MTSRSASCVNPRWGDAKPGAETWTIGSPQLGSCVLVFNPSDSTYPSTLAAAHEVKARGVKIIGVSDRPNPIYDHWIRIPHVEEQLFSILEILPIQLLAYHMAVQRKANPDYPRNLAKSVTVK